jgi:hypothetical protein
MADFSVDVARWVDKAKKRAEEAFQATAEAAVNRVKDLTPVRTGYLRANWTAIRDGDAEPTPGTVPDPMTAIDQAPLGSTLVVLNPVVYARRVEYGFVGEDSLGRHYNQPGRHMTQQTVAEMPSIAAAAVQLVINE